MNTASDSIDEIATVRIELQHNDPLIWRQVGAYGFDAAWRFLGRRPRP